MTAHVSQFGPVADYLPHRPPMLLIDEIIEVTADYAVCRTTLKPDCVFALDGRVHASSMIEFVAQVCAIGVGVTSAREGNPPRLGLIMGCREIAFEVDSFAIGDVLTIRVTKTFGQQQIAAFNGTVTRDGKILAKVQLNVVDAELASIQTGDPE